MTTKKAMPHGDFDYYRRVYSLAGIATEAIQERYTIAQYPKSIDDEVLQRILKDLGNANYREIAGFYNQTLVEDIYAIDVIKDAHGYHVVMYLDPFDLYSNPVLIESFLVTNTNALLPLLSTLSGSDSEKQF